MNSFPASDSLLDIAQKPWAQLNDDMKFQKVMKNIQNLALTGSTLRELWKRALRRINFDTFLYFILKHCKVISEYLKEQLLIH